MFTDFDKGYVGSYDPYTTTGRASAEGWWSFCNARPWLAGGFVWTGFDYRGEPSPNGWPNISSQYGIIDTCGFPKDSFYYYQSWWTEKPVLHLFPALELAGLWRAKKIAVWVYSNLDKVELFLNGKSLGAKDVKKDSHVAWNVPYAPGAIERAAPKDGKLVMTTKRETTGAAAKLVMKADRRGSARRWRGRGHVRRRSAGRAGPHGAHHRQRRHLQGSGAGKTDRRGQRRSHRPGIRQRHVAQGVLRILHGARPIRERRPE
jgi:hypothetical protein